MVFIQCMLSFILDKWEFCLPWSLLSKRTVHYKSAFLNFLTFFCASAECLISDRAALISCFHSFLFLLPLLDTVTALFEESDTANWWWHCQASWSLIHMVTCLVKKHLNFLLSKPLLQSLRLFQWLPCTAYMYCYTAELPLQGPQHFSVFG